MTANVTVPQQVSVTCPGCHSGQQVPRTATRIICQGCGKPIVFRKCDTTGKYVPGARRVDHLDPPRVCDPARGV